MTDAEFMHTKQAVLEQIRVRERRPQVSPYWFRMAAVAALCLVIIGTSIPVTFAAQDALPGEFLYSLKVNVIEEVEELFALTPEDRLLLQIERLEERIAEIEALIEMKAYTPESHAVFMEQTAEHAADAFSALQAIDEDPLTEIEFAGTLESKVQAHVLLGGILSDDSTVLPLLAEIITEIDAYTDTALPYVASEDVDEYILEQLNEIPELSEYEADSSATENSKLIVDLGVEYSELREATFVIDENTPAEILDSIETLEAIETVISVLE